jgi:3-oxoadipate enol-lactonase
MLKDCASTGRFGLACTVDQAVVLHRMIDASKLVIIENAAHLTNIGQPEAFNREVTPIADCGVSAATLAE